MGTPKRPAVAINGRVIGNFESTLVLSLKMTVAVTTPQSISWRQSSKLIVNDVYVYFVLLP